jgi:uncharacterized protein (DUF433 family)
MKGAMMSAITNEQLYTEIASIKQELKQIRETVAQYQVVQTTHPYIVKIEGVRGGEPITRNGYVSVRTIVEQTRLGTTPEELVKGLPPLSLAEIYDALSYYYDHQEEIEEIIQGHREALARVDELAARRAAAKAK